jgi:hypothetical protein
MRTGFDLLGKHHSVPCANDCTNDVCECVCHKGTAVIKYPVRVHDVHKSLVVGSDNSIICNTFSEEKATIIANTLNLAHDLLIIIKVCI